MTPLNLTDARCALFASALQRSDRPTAAMVATAISVTIQQIGLSGCVARMAQEFGDHPEDATERMRWTQKLAGALPVDLVDQRTA